LFKLEKNYSIRFPHTTAPIINLHAIKNIQTQILIKIL